MAPRSLSLLLLVLIALRESCFGGSSHSMKYFYTSISDPDQEQPYFVSLGYVDGQVFTHYDSNSRKRQPRTSWMEKVGKDDPQYWDGQTQRARGHEGMSRASLEILRTLYNQSEGGLHTWQWMYGCELRADGSKGGFDQYGYEGRTFITFDKETLTWVAPDTQAQITQRKWDAIPGFNQGNKVYLEEECIEWIKKYLSYGEEMLGRKEPPVVTMTSRTEVEDGMEMHVCRLDGFYPREIDASWRRDGEVWLQDTLHGSVAPNADGTHHYWLSILIDPKERGRYRCHVEHDGLQEPLDLALKDPESNLGLIIGCVVAVIVLLCVIVGILAFLKKRRDGYRVASRLDGRLAGQTEDPIGAAGTSSHSMNYLYTSISDPSRGLPQYVALGSVGSSFGHYRSSSSQKEQPGVPGMEKVGKEDPQYWDRETRGERGCKEVATANMEALRSLQSE